jgi:hypothetical protein
MSEGPHTVAFTTSQFFWEQVVKRAAPAEIETLFHRAFTLEDVKDRLKKENFKVDHARLVR